MTRREPRDLAEILVDRAAEDETTLRKLADDAEIADRILGLHAQQAVEKYLKAVLTVKQIRYEKTHNLAALVYLLDDSDTDDRGRVGGQRVQRVRAWAQQQVAQA